jgi:hypothetical protein
MKISYMRLSRSKGSQPLTELHDSSRIQSSRDQKITSEHPKGILGKIPQWFSSHASYPELFTSQASKVHMGSLHIKYIVCSSHSARGFKDLGRMLRVAGFEQKTLSSFCQLQLGLTNLNWSFCCLANFFPSELHDRGRLPPT